MDKQTRQTITFHVGDCS